MPQKRILSQPFMMKKVLKVFLQRLDLKFQDDGEKF
jgi:hypothetical protein